MMKRFVTAMILGGLAVVHTGCANPAAPIPVAPAGDNVAAAPDFTMLNPAKAPFSTADREDLSVDCGGGKGVLIAPRWVLTAAHCITWDKEKNGKVTARIRPADGKARNYRVDKVVRHGGKDLALLRLAQPVPPEVRQPVLLMRDRLQESDGQLEIKKVAGNAVWRGIPARGKGDNLTVRDKEDRRGAAGTSGGPWLIHAPGIGDVLVGITHGSGRAPQVGYAARWIEDTVRTNSTDRIIWVAKEPALVAARKKTP